MNDRGPPRGAPDVLGLHIGHNSALAAFRAGRPVLAIQEERLTRRKNQGGLPSRALEWLAETSGLTPAATVLGWNNLQRRRWSREDVLAQYGSTAGRLRAMRRLLRGLPGIGTTLDRVRSDRLRRRMGERLGRDPGKLVLIDHHRSHASAAYFGGDRHGRDSLVLTCDGAGDGLCATVSIGRGPGLERLASVADPHSLGRLYGLVTFLLGMVPLEHEYKLMGLAAYAEGSARAQELARAFRRLFRFEGEDCLTWRSTVSGGMGRALPAVEAIVRRQRFDHVAAGLQIFLEDFLCEWVTNCVRATGVGHIALGGGVFMNVKANQRILGLPDVDSVFVFPSCGDESNAFGASYAYLETELGHATEPLEHLYLGRDIDGSDVEDALVDGALDGLAVKVREIGEADVDEAVGEVLSRVGIVARARGRMEFGARALGNRSILADPAKRGVVRTINAMIKHRDFWMPFAPAVLHEDFDRYFVRIKDTRMPFMIMGCDTRPGSRNDIAGAIHPYDFTARPQEVDAPSNPGLAAAIRTFREATGRAAVLNTSFNLHGEPIVATAHDALRVFSLSGLPALAVGPFLIEKTSP